MNIMPFSSCLVVMCHIVLLIYLINFFFSFLFRSMLLILTLFILELEHVCSHGNKIKRFSLALILYSFDTLPHPISSVSLGFIHTGNKFVRMLFNRRSEKIITNENALYFRNVFGHFHK